MQITENTIEVAEPTATEDMPNENLTNDDLLNFISSEPTEDESLTEAVATEELEAETEEENGNDDLLQSGDETEEDEVESEDDDSDAEQTPKSVQKLLRQVGKLTARAKSAEENYESLQNELNSLREKKSEEKAKSASVNEVETFEELETLRQEAISAKKWARKHEGQEYVEENGQEFTKEQIKQIRDNAEDCLDEEIPARMKFLQEKHQSNTLASQTFGFLKEPKSEEFKLLQSINQNDRFKVLDTLPNGLYIKSLIVEGCRAVKSKEVKQTSKKATPTPPTEPIGEVSPPVQKVKKSKSKVLGSGNVTEDQLIAFLS
jgi:uncharacterized protein YnzC (UPF0291/DUF896 family)